MIFFSFAKITLEADYKKMVNTLSNVTKEKETAPTKKNEKKEQQPKQEKPQKKKAGKEDEEDEMDEVAASQPKFTDPLAALPAGSFTLDGFKRVYSNEDTLSKAIPYFWENFDPEHYRLILIHSYVRRRAHS